MAISRFIPFLKKAKDTGDEIEESQEVVQEVKKSLLFKLKEKQPQLSFTLSFLIALFGIFSLAIFPLLLVFLPFSLVDTILNANELNDWITVGIQLVVIGLSAAFSWAIFRLKFQVPTGLDVTAEKFPQLYKLVEELRNEFGEPKIDNVIIRDQYEIRIIKTPKDKLPFLSKTTLIIGLPVFLTMSPVYFRALLARRVGQLSTKHTLVTTRLYFLNDIWLQFASSARHSKNIFAKILGSYLKIYSRLYTRVLTPLLQDEEIEADRYGLDLVNEADMAECVVYEEVVTAFLKTKFWPKIYQMARRTKTPEFMPYTQMTKVIRAGITDEEISTIIKTAMNVGMHSPTAEPSLTRRLNHIGRAKPVPPKRLTKTAAEYYLGTALVKIIQLFDKRWLSKLQKKK